MCDMCDVSKKNEKQNMSRTAWSHVLRDSEQEQEISRGSSLHCHPAHDSSGWWAEPIFQLSQIPAGLGAGEASFDRSQSSRHSVNGLNFHVRLSLAGVSPGSATNPLTRPVIDAEILHHQVDKVT